MFRDSRSLSLRTCVYAQLHTTAISHLIPLSLPITQHRSFQDEGSHLFCSSAFATDIHTRELSPTPHSPFSLTHTLPVQTHTKPIERQRTKKKEKNHVRRRFFLQTSYTRTRHITSSSLSSLSFASLSLTVHRIALKTSSTRGSHATVYRYAARAACDCCNRCLFNALAQTFVVSYRIFTHSALSATSTFELSSSSFPLPFQRITFAYHLQRPPWPSSAMLKSHRCVYRQRYRITRERALWNVHPFSLQNADTSFLALSLFFLC